MREQADESGTRLRDQAADWVVRFSGDDVGEGDWLGFAAWLDSEPASDRDARRAAFDQAQAVWLELDVVAAAPMTPAAADMSIVTRGRNRSRVRRLGVRHGAWLAPLAAAACIAAFVGVTLTRAPTPPMPATTVYATGLGARRTIQLADGSRIDMNAASRLSVVYSPGERRVYMDQAEAAFDVVHNAQRPFIITVGDSQIRVLGTAFNIRNYDGDTQLSVSRGLVQMSADGRSARVRQGDAASHRQGGYLHVTSQAPAAALAWRTGRLLYVDQPISRVVGDLNRQYPRPIRLGDGLAARLRFTGVLALGSQDDTVRALTALLPLQSQIVDGEVVLRSR